MDFSSAEWFCEMNNTAFMDEYLMMNTMDNFVGYCSSPFPPLSSLTDDGFQIAGSVTNYKPEPTDALEPVQKKRPYSSSSPASSIISFANNSSGEALPDLDLRFGREAASKKSCSRSGVQAQDHVLAERKRREKLTQCFIALSALIPGLKKIDKATVLGSAIKHIKDLQERVKMLEERQKRHADESPAVGVKRVRLSGGDDDYSSDNNSDASTERALPEIEVRSSDQNILVTVHCKKHNGVIKEIFSEIQKLQLSVLSSTVMPFGKTTTHITIVAQVDPKFCMAAKDVANNIRMAILRLIRRGE